MENMVANVCEKFNYSRLRTDKVLGIWKSDNIKKHKTNKNNVRSAWRTFPGTKTSRWRQMCVLTFNQLLELVTDPVWSGWLRPASQSLMPGPTHRAQTSERLSLSTSGSAQYDRRATVISLKVSDIITIKVSHIEHHVCPHQHCLHHLQWEITQLLQYNITASLVV